MAHVMESLTNGKFAVRIDPTLFDPVLAGQHEGTFALSAQMYDGTIRPISCLGVVYKSSFDADGRVLDFAPLAIPDEDDFRHVVHEWTTLALDNHRLAIRIHSDDWHRYSVGWSDDLYILDVRCDDGSVARVPCWEVVEEPVYFRDLSDDEKADYATDVERDLNNWTIVGGDIFAIPDPCYLRTNAHNWPRTSGAPSSALHIAPAGERNTRAIPQDVKIAVSVRDRGMCRQCGSRQNLHFDHVVPWSRGGANTVNNIQLLCGPCNLRKGAYDIPA